MCPRFGWRLNLWHVKVRHSAPPRNLFIFEPFHYCTCSAPLSPTPFPVFLPHITSLPAHKTRTIGHDGVLPPTIFCEHASQVALVPQPPPYSLATPKQDEFFSIPFFRFNLNRYRTTTCPSHACRPLCCSCPTCLVARRPFPRACHSCFVCHRPYYHLALLAKPTR